MFQELVTQWLTRRSRRCRSKWQFQNGNGGIAFVKEKVFADGVNMVMKLASTRVFDDIEIEQTVEDVVNLL